MSIVIPSLRAAVAVPPWSKNTLWRRARAVPTLDLRFADNKSLTDAVTGASLVTFTRASSGTYVDSEGVIQTALTNVPRFDHNPVTGESLGLLVEEARTNSIRNNTMVGAVAGTPGTAPTNWILPTATGNISTVSIIGTGSEDGIVYSDIRVATTGAVNANIQFEYGVPASNGQTWTGSSYVKLVGGSLSNITTQIRVEEDDSGGAFLGTTDTTFVPTTANLITQRYSSTRTNNNASAGQERITIRLAFSGAGDITLRIGLPQLEQGAFATSVILTTTAAVTRSADVASITGTAFSGFYNQSEGTVFLGVASSNVTSGRILQIGDGTSNNRQDLLFTSGPVNYFMINGGSSQTNMTTFNSATTGQLANIAAGYETNNVAVVLNSGSLVTDDAATLPTVDQVGIGRRLDTSAYLNGTIRRLTFWPQRLANITLQQITQ